MLHLVVFGKLFLIHNLGIEYIIPRFGHCFLFLKHKITSVTHTLHITKKKKVTICFHNIYEYITVFLFIDNKNTEKLYSFLYSNPAFRILKNEK